MEDTWTGRDLPVLDAVVSKMDEVNRTGQWPDAGDIAAFTGLGVLDVAAALDALEGDYLDLQRTSGDPSAWFVTSVTSAARREVGQWPTGESMIDRLVGGIGEAAEEETDPEKKRRLQAVARELGGMAKAVAINVTSQMLEYRLPH
jgi:hypothetical protein